MVKFILIKSPDEWATTKQACRDELVVYLSFSSIYTTLYFYVLSTVLRKSGFTLASRIQRRIHDALTFRPSGFLSVHNKLKTKKYLAGTESVSRSYICEEVTVTK